MRNLTRALLVTAALSLCTGGALAQDNAPDATAAAAEAAAPEAIAPEAAAPEAVAPIGTGAGSRHLMPPPADKAQMVFFRRSGLLGAAISAHVKDGETPIGHLANGQYFVALVDPGRHSFSVKTEATDTLEMEVEPGETYFVEETAAMGIIVYRLNLSPSDLSAFDKAFPKIKPSKPLKK